MKRLAIAVAIGSLMACSGGNPTAPTSSVANASIGGSLRTPPSTPPPTTSATCDATKVQFTYGQRVSTELVESARVAARARVARVIRPNDTITPDSMLGRLNLVLNAQDIVQSAYCG